MTSPVITPTVLDLVDSLLSQLAVAPIDLPSVGSFNFVLGLKTLGRSGKLVRIVHYGLKLPVQSHYDHIRSVARLADICTIGLGLTERDLESVARFIAFHDLAEVVVGDIPEFTSTNLTDGVLDFRSPLSADMVNEELGRRLPEPLAASFRETLELLSSGDDEAFRFFKMMDRIEPITAVWRYIRTYHDAIDIDAFLQGMADFFLNPKPRAYCISDETRSMVEAFQESNNAKDYFQQGAVMAFALPPLCQVIITEFMEAFPIEPVTLILSDISA